VAVVKKHRGIIDKLKNENTGLKNIISKMNAQKMQAASTMYPRITGSENMVEELKS